MTTGTVHRLTVPLSARDHVQGDLDARFALVEYGDYECPYCRAAHPVVKEVERRLDGQLAFAFRHFPIVNAHRHALRASEAAEAAGSQGRFWLMHDRLFESAVPLEDETLIRYAVQIGLDVRNFVSDLAAHRFLDRIREDMSSGARSGVNGTPTFFVNGIRHDGPHDAMSLIAALPRSAASQIT